MDDRDDPALERPAATIVIPTRDRRHSLERALRAIERQSVPPDRFEVVVVVDGSRDDTADWLRTQAFPFALTRLWRDGGGRAAACNAGLEAAHGDLIVFLDDDMEPAPTWLAAHLAAHDRERGGGPGSPSEVAIVGAAPSADDPAMSRAGRYLARRFDRHLAKLARADALTFRDVYTGNASIARAALATVGGFDESFTAYGNEDGDLAIRLEAAGLRWRFDPDAVAVQHQDKDLAAAFRDARAKGRTAVQLATRHPGQAGRLRLGRRDSGRRRAVRSMLLGATRIVPGLPTAVVRLVSVVERIDPPGMDRLYEFVFDYGYWLGVASARREVDGDRGRARRLP